MATLLSFLLLVAAVYARKSLICPISQRHLLAMYHHNMPRRRGLRQNRPLHEQTRFIIWILLFIYILYIIIWPINISWTLEKIIS